MSRPVLLADYDPAWPEAYAAEAAALRHALVPAEEGGVLHDLAHIGSTSVPGLLAKPCLDIMARVHPLPPPPERLAALADLGYEHLGEHGIPGRHYLRRGDAVHLHVVSFDTDHWARHVLFRDLLRSDPVACRRYADLKRALAAQHRDDRAAYTDGKSALIAELDALAAERHVQITGFAPPRALALALAGLDAPWAIAGGWAIDLAAGAPSRYHDDLDLAIPQQHAPALAAHLAASGWDVQIVLAGGRYTPWTPRPLPPEAHQLHARCAGTFLDILIEPWEGDTWRFRRDPAITLPGGRALQHALGLPVLAAEAVLLFKANTRGAPPRPRDHHDLRRALPRLDPDARAWLRAALERTAPAHPWIAALL